MTYENPAIVDEVVEKTAIESAEVEQSKIDVVDHLTPELAKNVEKYGAMDEEDREIYLTKLKKGGRKGAIEAISEVYGIEAEKESIPEDEIEKMKQVYLDVQRKEVAKQWAKKTGIPLDHEQALRNKDFIKEFYSNELSTLPLEVRTELAMSRIFGGRKPNIEKQEKAKSFTQSVAGTKKEEINKDSFINLIVANSRR